MVYSSEDELVPMKDMMKEVFSIKVANYGIEDEPAFA